MKVSQHILNFLLNLKFNIPLPEDFEVLHPFDNAETKRVCEEFYNKYYGDENKRFCIIGINPGRFGAGLTGIPFTDPIRLERELGIQNEWQKKQELSSFFIYEMIDAFGGPEKFYRKFYFTAVSPLGFVKNGKNINYYDDKSLLKAIPPFVQDCLEQQLPWIRTSVAFCLGEGKNFDCLSRLNNDFLVFNKIVPLPHPRFIMQYKLKKKAEYIEKYLKALNQD
jgi:uracil-DNA glycosylase